MSNVALALYPDPTIPVPDYTTVTVGDVIRYPATDPRGIRIDDNDYLVTGIDTDPVDLTDGTPSGSPRTGCT